MAGERSAVATMASVAASLPLTPAAGKTISTTARQELAGPLEPERDRRCSQG
jgi:hypothetical protein